MKKNAEEGSSSKDKRSRAEMEGKERVVMAGSDMEEDAKRKKRRFGFDRPERGFATSADTCEGKNKGRIMGTAGEQAIAGSSRQPSSKSSRQLSERPFRTPSTASSRQSSTGHTGIEDSYPRGHKAEVSHLSLHSFLLVSRSLRFYGKKLVGPADWSNSRLLPTISFLSELSLQLQGRNLLVEHH